MSAGAALVVNVQAAGGARPALGVQVAHSGTVAGFLFEPGPGAAERIEQAREGLRRPGVHESWEFSNHPASQPEPVPEDRSPGGRRRIFPRSHELKQCPATDFPLRDLCFCLTQSQQSEQSLFCARDNSAHSADSA